MSSQASQLIFPFQRHEPGGRFLPLVCRCGTADLPRAAMAGAVHDQVVPRVHSGWVQGGYMVVGSVVLSLGTESSLTTGLAWVLT